MATRVLGDQATTQPPALAMAAGSVAISGLAAVGSILAYRSSRWWPFLLGLAITALPLILYVVLPGPPPIGGAGGD
jgi:hypothetical protein